MSNLLVLGTQWGDEGKGKIVDLLTPDFDLIARYQGGHNAGHTVCVNGRKIVLHLIPSGILHPEKICLIGNGLVVSPPALFQEIEALKAQGVEVEPERLVISKYAHVIMPWHPLIERIAEQSRGEKKIGTTCRGIGPAYEDKTGRWGIRMCDLVDREALAGKVEENLKIKNKILESYGLMPLDAGAVVEEYTGWAMKIAPFVRDVSKYINDNIQAGKSVLFEGAQGTLLDLDHGTYPFVTSSSSTAGGVCTGLGVSPRLVDYILGITKAYTTRVGSGPFPTELLDECGKTIAARGDEFGATTGRPRRCGWFDAVAVRYACRINGVDSLALTKTDVLGDFPQVLIATGYRYKGDIIKDFPLEPWILEKVEPIYRLCPGWPAAIKGKNDFESLPATFKDFVKLIEDLVETPVSIISTGMDREHTVVIGNKLK